MVHVVNSLCTCGLRAQDGNTPLSWNELKVVAEAGFEELLQQKEYERAYGLEPSDGRRGRSHSPSKHPFICLPCFQCNTS